MVFKDRVRASIEGAVSRELEPGERVLVSCLAFGSMNLKHRVLPIMLAFGPLFQRNYHIAVTDRRIIVFKAEMVGWQPRGLLFADPRLNTEVVEFRRGLVFTKVALRRASGAIARFYFQRLYYKEAAGIRELLKGAGSEG